MEHVGERENEGLFDFVEFGQREAAFVELTVAQTGVKNVIDQLVTG